jgi:hypothetical protein
MNMYWTTPIRRQKNWSPTLSLRLSLTSPLNDFGLPPCGLFLGLSVQAFLRLEVPQPTHSLRSNTANA